MLIDQYFEQIDAALTTASIIQHMDMQYDRRDKSTGFIRGTVTFTDDSILHIREFVTLIDQPHRLMYSYQYMDASKVLIFRYDDTDHHQKLNLATHPHHKHDGSEENVVESTAPTLTDVLDEIGVFVRIG